MSPKVKSRKGSVLVTVILILTIFSIFIGSVLFLQRYSLRKAQRFVSGIRAEYLAEAGVYKALWFLKGNGGKDISWQTENYTEEISGYGSYAFSIKRNGHDYIITSAGKSKKPVFAKKRVRAVLRFALPPAFDYALYTTEYIEVDTSKTNVSGGIASRGNITLLNNLEDKKYELYPETNVSFPELENMFYREKIGAFDYFLSNSGSAQKTYDSAQGFNRTHIPDFKQYKTIFVKGKTIIEGGSEIHPFYLTGAGTLISSGLLEIEDTVRIKGPLNIIAKEGIIVGDNSVLENVTIYSPEKVRIKDNARVGGLILSKKQIKISGNSEILSGAVIYTEGIKQDGRLRGEIIVENNSVVRGTIICDYDPSLSVTANRTVVYLRPGCEIYGVVYSRNIIDMEGIVYGTVVSRALKDNRWRRGKINHHALPDNYVLPRSLQSQTLRRFKIHLWEKL
ncbi:MAG: hypothetical protein J7M11_02985 [Elusimicrobia bacterium]|nr:hypothetical protein [Elusimicrobiota bacterium]